MAIPTLLSLIELCIVCVCANMSMLTGFGSGASSGASGRRRCPSALPASAAARTAAGWRQHFAALRKRRAVPVAVGSDHTGAIG
jgi:hypothetical protein